MTQQNPTLEGLPFSHRGKVRDTYDLGDQLLLVATDRISAFDYVLPTVIPDKGKMLNGLSVFWSGLLGDIVPNHLINGSPEQEPRFAANADALRGRSMLVHKAERIDFECVVRGYLAGSGWSEYQKTGTLAGLDLPAGLVDGDRLPEPAFTPARKNDEGHDENISHKQLQNDAGTELADRLKDVSLRLYETGREYAAQRGIILADTKFEFGMVDGRLTLIDEVFTPDSSRFWLVGEYKPGRAQPSLDKQFVRDWLLASGWDRNSDPPALPDEVVFATRQRYLQAYRQLTGTDLAV